MSKLNKLMSSAALSPILWGAFATALFYLPVRAGKLLSPDVARFFTGHWSEALATTLFAVAMMMLATRWMNVRSQLRMVHVPLLDAISAGGQPITMCDSLLKRLEAQPAEMQHSVLVRRLRDALEYVFRKSSADTLDDELRFLASRDRERMHESYAALRTLTWSVPIVGMLGTAVWYAQSPAESTPRVFDCVSMSLALWLPLVFAKQRMEQLERGLIAAVDARAAAELVGRFEPSINLAVDPQVTVVRRLSEHVMQSSEKLVARQTELWSTTFVEAQKQWHQWSQGASEQLQLTLAKSLAKTMDDHAAAVAKAHATSAAQNAQHWAGVQQALLQNAEAVTLQQRELVRQGEILMEVVAATGQIAKLESELNRNLSTLAGAKNFEQTVNSLAATIHLLNGKLEADGIAPPKISLKQTKRPKAA